MTKRALRRVSEEDLKVVDDVRRHRMRRTQPDGGPRDEAGSISCPILIPEGLVEDAADVAMGVHVQVGGEDEEESSETESESDSCVDLIPDPPRQWRRSLVARRGASQVVETVYKATFGFIRKRQR